MLDGTWQSLIILIVIGFYDNIFIFIIQGPSAGMSTYYSCYIFNHTDITTHNSLTLLSDYACSNKSSSSLRMQR